MSASGKAVTAIAKFPSRGVSDDSDRIAAAIRAGLVRGASIGFMPLKWAFVTDPARPFGVDFQSIRLLEWSVCSVPCNPACLLIRSIAGPKASHSSQRVEEWLAEARAKARNSARPSSTRAQRLAEARELRRIAQSHL
jgi:hypothetical protein